ncbi:MAG: DUF4625 domain-containing protein [Prevotella sp.]|jgi:hypothetical protein|nr:DUF4625 domain-containing protein [Prevotella sp.]
MKTIFKYLLLSISIIATVFLFTSCDSDDNGDTTPPVINLISPVEDGILKIGGEHGIHLDMELSDNEMLSSYKVEIHNDFDGHTHTSSLKSAETTPFSFQKSWDLSGQKTAKIHHHEIIIPENATPGNYHLMVYCTDAAGNESYVARDIVLSHDGDDDDDHDH